ncbi:MAG TPA: hypothetical protein VFD32_22685 [Dehalococcoidia bacterium]|nr:hypothetical protein [Dehalococcoidia bacterium]
MGARVPLLTDWLQVIASLGSLLSGLGLLGTMGSLLIFARQARASEQATIATAYQAIVSAGSNNNMLYLEHPELLAGLNDPKYAEGEWDFEQLRQEDTRLILVSAQVLDYYELVLVTMGAFPRHLRAEWQDYIRNQLQRQPFVRRVLLSTDWYTEELRALGAAESG